MVTGKAIVCREMLWFRGTSEQEKRARRFKWVKKEQNSKDVVILGVQ